MRNTVTSLKQDSRVVVGQNSWGWERLRHIANPIKLRIRVGTVTYYILCFNMLLDTGWER